ncbi:MAG: RidA family protein [Bacillota bacterium]|jgi:2-iminobutanoate/2-iminopropanoate deaminase
MQTIHTHQAPAAIGPYSQAIRTGNLIFCSGQLPINPQTGQLLTGSIAEQTDQVMQNIRAILTAAGASLRDVVKTTIFLADMNDFAAVNETYGKYFQVDPPARSTVQVARLPKDARVEIEVVAAVK